MNLARTIHVTGDGRMLVDGEVAPFDIGPDAVVRSEGGVTTVTVTIPCLEASVSTIVDLDVEDVEHAAEAAARSRLKAKGPAR